MEAKPHTEEADPLRAEAREQERLAFAIGTGADDDYAKRARHLAAAVDLWRRCGDAVRETKALVLLANTANNQADSSSALDHLQEGEAIARRLGDAALLREVIGETQNVLLGLGDHDAVLASAREQLAGLPPGPGMARLMALNTIGCALDGAGRFEEALVPLMESLAMLDALDGLSARRRAHLRAQSAADLAWTLVNAGRADEALVLARAACADAEAHAITPLVQLARHYVGRALLALGHADAALGELDEALQLARRMQLHVQEARILRDRAEALAALGRHAEAYATTRDVLRLEAEARRDEAVRRAGYRHARTEIDAARRDAEIADRALHAVLPAAIARRVKAGEARIAEERPFVSVLFADVAGFTAASRALPARELVERLDALFTRFDALTAAAGLDKIKTIGDAYMVVGGALADDEDHLARAVELARALLGEFGTQDARLGWGLGLRIGLHAGPVVAGVIGRERLAYDLWGDTVNFASRLESGGVPGRIHVSDAVVRHLEGRCAFEARGLVDLKGLGPTPTWFVGDSGTEAWGPSRACRSPAPPPA